jgi:hypothetical protein
MLRIDHNSNRLNRIKMPFSYREFYRKTLPFDPFYAFGRSGCVLGASLGSAAGATASIALHAGLSSIFVVPAGGVSGFLLSAAIYPAVNRFRYEYKYNLGYAGTDYETLKAYMESSSASDPNKVIRIVSGLAGNSFIFLEGWDKESTTRYLASKYLRALPEEALSGIIVGVFGNLPAAITVKRWEMVEGTHGPSPMWVAYPEEPATNNLTFCADILYTRLSAEKRADIIEKLHEVNPGLADGIQRTHLN